MVDRSTKKQKELLDFVDGFIAEHGYGPSYREIMRLIGYKSVSTVAVHIDGLIKKGYLRKRDHSARSLEVVSTQMVSKEPSKTVPSAAREKWITAAINERFERYKSDPTQSTLDELYVLIGALKILGFEAAHESAKAQLSHLRRV